jgi:uncharacterized phage protein (TIGR01671 family)
MHREIKFRVWDNENKTWIDPWWIQFGSYNRLITDVGCYVNLQEHPDRYVIQQYTGVKDKNGKEVYEGDIINVIESSLYHSRVEVAFTGTVIYDVSNVAFQVINNEGKQSSFIGQEVSCEVIGNIFEYKK